MEIGVKDENGLYGGEQLKRGEGPGQRPLDDKDCRILSMGSQKNFTRKKKSIQLLVLC